MPAYELCVLFPGTQTPAEIDERAKQVDGLLAAAGAEVKLAHSLGRRKLAYPISGQAHGDYRWWLFLSDKNALPALNEKLRLNTAVIRHLLIALSSHSLEKKIQRIKEGKTAKVREAAPAELPEAIAVPEAIKPKEKVKLSLDDLDKKLDEILESDKI